MKLKDTQTLAAYRYGWLLSRIYPFMKPYLGRILLGILIAVPLGLLDGVTAFALKPYMDYVIGQQDFVYKGFTITFNALTVLLPLAVIVFAVVQGLLKYFNTYLTYWTSEKITIAVKSQLFKKLTMMNSGFYDENTSGILLSRYIVDPEVASKGIIENIRAFVTSFFGAVGLIVVMLFCSWQLAVVAVVVLCGAFLPIAIIRKRIKKTSNETVVIQGNMKTNLNETYIGNKVVQSYGLQDRQQQLFDQQLAKGFRVMVSLLKRAGWMSPLMYLIASCGIATVLWFGTKLILSGTITAGSFASFVTSLLLLYKPVKTLGNTLTNLQNIFVAMGRVFELFDVNSDIVESPDAKELAGLNEAVTFENVDFEYIKGQPVLKNINLTVKKGETIAFVGNSGGGKSTLVNLIPRFYDVIGGKIKFDGVDVRDLTLKSLRDNIAMVFQDNFLFTGTIRDNILMGKPEAATEELDEAIRAAHLGTMLLEMPNGVDTELGERGTTLSGGQRQRVAIARAIIKNAPIIVLDEATSALDNESEAIVQMALDNLIKDKTVFLIAHRFSTIRNADRIAVINDGEIVEIGTHDELMSIENGQYKLLFDMQFRSEK